MTDKPKQSDPHAKARRIAEARATLAEAYAANPEAVRGFRGRMAKIEAARKRERERLAALVFPAPSPEAKRKGKKGKAPDPPVRPTAEQEQRGRYAEETRVEQGQISRNRIYRRQPHFELLAKRSEISEDQLACLRWYRNAWEMANASETKCALDVRPRGTGTFEAAIDASLDRGNLAAVAEAGLGGMRETVRLVALHDHTYADIAIARFGSRPHHDRPVPRSGRHRDIIRKEFMVGLKRLAASVTTLLGEFSK